MKEPLLSFEKVSHYFPDGGCGLDSVRLDLFPGELLILAGANGAGKTLLMRHALGLVKPSGGDILYRGQSIYGRIGLVRRKIGVAFQHPEEQIIEDSVAGEIAFGPENLGVKGTALRETVETAMSTWNLTDLKDRHPMSLSGGERRRVALASVFAMNPEILLLDEPFMELDYPGVRSLLGILLGLHAQGLGICIITHDVGKILAHADRIAIMNAGALTAQGRPEKMLGLLEENGIRNPCKHGLSLQAASWN